MPTSPTNFEDFNVYVPWVNCGQPGRSAAIVPDHGVQEVNGQRRSFPLDLDQYINNRARTPAWRR